METGCLGISLVDHVRHVGREHKWNAVSLDAAKLLIVAKVLAVVDVEEVAALGQHHVVVVAVPDTLIDTLY